MHFRHHITLIILSLLLGEVVAQDTIPPILMCKNRIQVSMDHPSGSISIPAQEFVLNASDDQTVDSLLSFHANGSFSEYIITCDSFDCHGGDNRLILPVRISCTDESGNQATCSSEIDITNNDGICSVHSPTINIEVSDHVNRESIDNITFHLRDENGVISTDSSYMGWISFHTSCNFYGTIYPSAHLESFLSGVSTKDLVTLRKHLLGRNKFEHPWQYIAADIDGDLKITVRDLSLLKSIILNKKKLGDIPFQSSWQIFLANAPIESDWTSWVNFVYKDVDAQVKRSAHYTAIKLGDITK